MVNKVLRGRARGWLVAIAATLLLLVLLIGAFPVNLLRDIAAQRLSDGIGAKVSVGSLERRPFFSFTPTIAIRDLSIDQPAWAGPGKLLTVSRVEARIPVWSALFGDGAPQALRVEGLTANLIRNADKRNNWSDNETDRDGGGRPNLRDLVIENSRFTLRDDRRTLAVAGTIAANAREGFRVEATGTFHDAPATIVARGGRIAGVDPQAPYPFALKMRSPLLDLDAQGRMAGVFAVKRFSAKVSARARDLEYLDDIIEAGLIRTQDIDLVATVRRDWPVWNIESLKGRIGRSPLTGKAVVRKQNGRSKIDGDIRFAALEFADLSSHEGQARAAARRAALGPRVLPPTRINLTKIGRTDGVLRVRADRLIIPRGSVFRSLSGTLNLQGKTLTVTDLVAGMERGRLSGSVSVEQGSGPPLLDVDARLEGATLAQLFGTGAQGDGPVRGRIRLRGRGDTIREALSRADGRVALVVRNGSINETIAHVLGQDLGRAIGQALGDSDARVPLRCVIASFASRSGVLRPDPLLLETEVSSGRGSGAIRLDGETIALTLAGASTKSTALRIEDPVRIGGTLSRPVISIAGVAAKKQPTVKTALKVIGKSLGGLFDGKKAPRPVAPGSIGCARLADAALR